MSTLLPPPSPAQIQTMALGFILEFALFASMLLYPLLACVRVEGACLRSLVDYSLCSETLCACSKAGALSLSELEMIC